MSEFNDAYDLLQGPVDHDATTVEVPEIDIVSGYDGDDDSTEGTSLAPEDSNAQMPSRGHELAGQQVEAKWIHYPGGCGSEVELSLGGQDVASFTGNFTDEGDLQWGPLRVDEAYRGAGAATRLVKALAHTAVSQQAHNLYGFVESQHTLRALRHIAPDSATDYSTIDPTTLKQVQIPMTTDQAIQSLERAQTFEKNLEYRRHGFTVYVNTAKIDRSALEEPIDTGRLFL